MKIGSVVITIDGQLKTVLMSKDRSAMNYTVRQVPNVAEFGYRRNDPPNLKKNP